MLVSRPLRLAAALVIGLGAPSVLSGGGGAHAQDADGNGTGRIVVSAEGQVAAVPDMATVTLGVVSEAATAQDAVAGMSEAAQSLLDRLAEQGVAERDFQTSGLNLSPRWRREEGPQREAPEIVGYTAETTVTARIRALETLGEVLDAAVRGGVNQFRGLSFGLAETMPVMDAARRAAVAEGARRAAVYAEAAGVTLGPLLHLEEGGGPQPRPVMRADMAMAEAMPVPVAEGEMEVTVRVRMVYAIAGE
jgi:hypothetical protein